MEAPEEAGVVSAHIHRLCPCGSLAASRSPTCLACGCQMPVNGPSKDTLTNVERALLERDAADVQHAFDDEDEDRRLSQWEADMCEAWLVRARAAL